MRGKRTKIVLIGALLVIAIAGCATTIASKPADPKTAAKKADQVLDADIVVVGAGGGGLSASIQAAQLGNKVILLEKLGFTGGTSAMTEGMFGVESHWQKEAGVTLTAAEVLGKCMEYHHWLANPSLTKAFFDMSGETIDWVESLGLKFKSVNVLGKSLRTWHVFDGLGSAAMASLTKAAKAAGVTILLETPGKELVMENDKIAGIIAQNADGKTLFIKTKAVILTTGGFANSEEMINKYTVHDFKQVEPIGAPKRTGDGITMGMNVGADTIGMSAIMMCGGVLKNLGMESQLSCAAGRSPFLWVNEKGSRFADESIVFNFSFAGNAMGQQKQVFSVMDEASIDYLINVGCIMGRGVYIPTGSKLTNLRKELDAQLTAKNPDVICANSIEELAAKMGVDSSAFTQQVNRYNEICASGQDDQFGKGAKFLQPITTAPYYAFHLAKAYYTTVGGLKIDTKAQVLSTSGSVIPGLYAAGSDAGGLYGDSYDVGIAAGSQEGFAINFGRVAARSASEYLKN